jgi:hypothetical protein
MAEVALEAQAHREASARVGMEKGARALHAERRGDCGGG